jgi:ABC-type maltose transport system permease subunit
VGDRPDGGVSELNPLAEVRQARMAGIIWDERFARVTDLAGRFPVLVVFLLLQKQFVAGMTLGATKG